LDYIYDLLVTASDVTKNRPNPDMILLAMEKLNILDAASVIKVGDSTIDIEEGRNAGCLYNIGVTTGAHTKAELSTAGLTFGARVSKIDDNGFVTFSLSPQISAVVDTTEGANSCGRIDILSVRRLDTGTVRVRDGQTLILTGVISDEDIQQVTKWPILGDIPFVGQFFRGSRGSRRKSELVIMVTPRIVADSDSYASGYGYRPSLTESKRMLSEGG